MNVFGHSFSDLRSLQQTSQVENSFLSKKVIGQPADPDFGHFILIALKSIFAFYRKYPMSGAGPINLMTLCLGDGNTYYKTKIIDGNICISYNRLDMKWVYIEDIAEYNGQKVELRGWVYNKRSSGKIRFLLLRDGTGIIQGTAYSPEKDNPLFIKFNKLTQESSIIIRGLIKEDKRAPSGYEIDVEELEIIQIAEEYPITPKEHGTPFLMENRHLWFRSQKQNAILQIRTEIIRAIRNFFDGRGFRLMDTPILTPSACEGTTTLFETEYFDQKAYLSQSGQLYNEATAMAFGKVYCFGPTFRAEKSKTRKHLIEFWMVEPEVAVGGKALLLGRLT